MTASGNAPELYNRPGLPALAYRIGEYGSFLARLLENLPTQTVSLGSTPLSKLTTREPNDAAIALLDAWAVVADVLTFYQERIANEGYLLTATERRSLLALARAIGYELNPGVAASTFLAFSVEDTPSSAGKATVPKGTAINSIPGEGERPQTFETSSEIIARAEWNAIRPRLAKPQEITSNTQQLYLQGISTQLRAGDYLLLMDDDEQKDSRNLLTLESVEPVPAAGYTCITWKETEIKRPPRHPKVFTFRQRAALFGHNAPQWKDMPDEIKRAAVMEKGGSIPGGVFRFRATDKGDSWDSVSNGLPNTDIRCLAINRTNGYLFAGTPERGIFRSKDEGKTWTAVNSGLTNLNVQVLWIDELDEPGYLFAGTAGGGVFRSTDDGESWVSLGVGSVRVESQGSQNARTINTGLPNTVVRSLVAFTSDQETSPITPITNLVAGTISSDGTTVTGTEENFSQQLEAGDIIVAAGQARIVTEICSATEVNVNAAFDPNLPAGTAFFAFRPALPLMGRTYLFAGTDDGVYCSLDRGKNWNPFNTDLPNAVVHSLITYKGESNDTFYILAGTDRGLFRCTNNQPVWQFISELGTQDIRVLAINQTNSYLFVGTANGLFRSSSTDNGSIWGDWQLINTPELTNTNVQTLVITSNGHIFAGTVNGVFCSEDNGNNWKEIKGVDGVDSTGNKTHQLAATNVTSLAINAGGTLFAGTRFEGFVQGANPENVQGTKTTNQEGEWPDFQIKEREIDLDTAYPQILANSWVVLVDGSNIKPFQVESVSTPPRRDFSLDTKVTRLVPKTSVNPREFRLRNTLVLAQSESLKLVEEPLTVLTRKQNIFLDPIHDNQIFLSQFVQGLQPEQTLIVSGKRIRAQIEDVGGVFSSSDQGNHWQRTNKGLMSTSVTALSAIANNWVAGTASNGVFYSTDNGSSWTPINGKLTNTDITSLATYTQQGTEAINYLFAGTASGGVFRSRDNGNSWKSISTGLVHPNVQTLAINSQGDIFAATLNGGVFISSDRGDNWTQTGLTNTDVQSLAIHPENGHLFAGTRDGVFRSTDNGNSWSYFTDTKPGTGTISSKDITVTGTATAFTRELRRGDTITAAGQTRTVTDITSDTVTVNTAFRPDLPAGTTFTVKTGLTNTNITALLPYGNTLFAGTAGSGIFRSTSDGEWWEQVNTNLTSLDIRCLAVDASNGHIFAGTARGGVFRSSNNGDSWIPMNIGLTNTDVRALVIQAQTIFAGGVGILLNADGSYHVELKLGDLLQVMTPPVAVLEQPQGFQKWVLCDRNGFVGVLVTATSKDINLLPAGDDDAKVSEVCSIQTPPDDQEHPILTFKEPLNNTYDPETVVIYGNVVRATHGETVSEVLGSGDGAIANQRFALSKPPLTYISAATVSGAESTLQLRIDDVLWDEVHTLYQHSSHDQCYIVRIEDNGTTTITFGDGQSGTRLPSGQENVVATYRSGIGLEGNVTADSLSLLKRRPLGIQAVTNPLPATGAAPPETLEEARAKVPSTVRTLDRIVSLQDFEDFTRAFAGIGKAQAVPLWNGEAQFVHITVAARDGGNVPPDSALYDNLVQAIDAVRDPFQLVEVSSYERLWFNLEATIIVEPRYEAKAVLASIRTALMETFAFDKREFGQAVTASEAIAAIHQVKGVVAVDLDALYRFSFAKSLESSLSAATARWDRQDNKSLPAQLLLVNSRGISLKTQLTL